MKYPGMTWGLMEAVVNKLGGMEGVNRFLSGNAEVVVKNHAIDLDALPFTPDGWSVEEHRTGGLWTFDPKKVELYLADEQKGGKVIQGNKLRKELANKPVWNANVLDYLLANPHIIPEEWKGKYVFFWGTIYRSRDGDLCVRCLYSRSDRWVWSCRWRDYVWRDFDPAAVRAS